ncbi:hypothetical protein [Desulfovibrio cuneatus]|uniref:hypothetical protein n=1 Tax=Desulfovibrio cuneatus TaxID=159728 RepID=UPI0004800428|nr:hypothetical protein [Desulfovibrio cuneatus]
MSINAIGQTRGMDTFFNEKVRKTSPQPSQSFGVACTVNISSEAIEKYFAMKNANQAGENGSTTSGDVAAKISDWYDDFRKNMGMVDEPDYSAWPPENQARRQQLLKERDVLWQAASNTSFTDANRKLNRNTYELMTLDAIGGQQVLSDSDMGKARDALYSAMDRWEHDLPGTTAWLAGEGSFNNGQPPASGESLVSLAQKNFAPSEEEEVRLKRERLLPGFLKEGQ